MKKIMLILLIFVINLTSCGAFFARTPTTNKNYGVFIGAGPNQLSKMYGYSTVILDASNFSTEDIKSLQSKGSKVYSYINLGSIEDFRPYYEKFESITLGDYEGWAEEHWIDVSKPQWQEYLTTVIAQDLVNKGINGFFVDNLDVYAVYKEESIYQGILQILSSLKATYGLPIIVNGGYEFISASLTQDYDISQIINGVNQECVFSFIDFSRNRLKINKAEERDFVLSYLKTLQKQNLTIYLIEYTKSNTLAKQIINYCTKNNFNYYITPSITLE